MSEAVVDGEHAVAIRKAVDAEIERYPWHCMNCRGRVRSIAEANAELVTGWPDIREIGESFDDVLPWWACFHVALAVKL